MPHGVGERDPEAIVRDFVELQTATHFETGAATDDHAWDIVEGMTVSLPELFRPDKQGMIEHASLARGLGNFRQSFCEVGELATEPGVDPAKLVLESLVAIGLMGEGVMSLLDSEPAHPCLAHRAHIL